MRPMRPLPRLLLLAVLLALPATSAAAQAPDQVVGTVARIEGRAVAIQDALPRALDLGSPVQAGDIVSTGKDSRVELKMNDGGSLTLGARTQFIVQEYVVGQQGNNAVMRLLEGAFLATSGRIMETADASFVVETEAATIGIRGTTVWGGPIDGAFEVALLEGTAITVETKAGRVEMTTPGEGTRVEGADVPPAAPVIWPDDKVQRALATVAFQQ